MRAVPGAFCGCAWQGCVTHLQRNLQGHARTLEGKGAVAALVGAAAARRDPLVARAVWEAASPWVGRVSAAAGGVFDSAREDALAFMSFPGEHRGKIGTNNVQERANREIKRRARSARTFPSAGSLLRPVGCVLMGEEGRWASQGLFSPASAAGPDAERLEAARLYASQIVGEVVDRFGLRK